MLTKHHAVLSSFLLFCCCGMSPSYAAASQPAPEDQKQPAISLPEDVGTTIAQKAASVKTEFATRSSSLFERTPIGWDWNAIEYLYKRAVGLPLQLPEIIQQIMEQSVCLGWRGPASYLFFWQPCCKACWEGNGYLSAGHQGENQRQYRIPGSKLRIL